MFTRIRRFISFLLGDFSWQPPAWLRRGGAGSLGWVRGHRRASSGLALLLAALVIGGWEGWVWYRDRPRPVTISVEAEAPGITPLGEVLIPRPLVIRFAGSVARLEDYDRGPAPSATPVPQRLGRPPAPLPTPAVISLHNVRLEPAVEGVWHWACDNRLVFQPKNDWPAGRTYKVVLDQALFPEHVLLERYEVEVKTPSFTASMPKLEFYTDPTEPTVKQITATFEFSHKVSAGELEKHLEMTVIGGTEIFPAGQPRFTVTPGPHQRTMYVRTSALVLPEHEDFLRATLDESMPTLQGGGVTGAVVEKKVLVPDLYSFFRIKSATGHIVHNPEGDPEQILTLETRGACRSEDLQHALHVFLLPKRKPEKDDEDNEQKWQSAREVDEEVLKRALLLPVKAVPSGQETSELHSFRVAMESEGQLYVSVDKGAKALGGFLLGEKYEAVTRMPDFPREIEIQGSGGVLALNGERKLSIQLAGRGKHSSTRSAGCARMRSITW